MTENDILEQGGLEQDETSNFRRAITLLLGAVALIFLAGVLVGFGSSVLEDENYTLTAALILVGIVAAIGIVGVLTWKQFQERRSARIAQSERKSRNIYIASMVIGAVIGFYIMSVGGPEFDTMFSNGPISPAAAIGALVGWLVAMPVITVLWWRATDEHELKAYSDGALFAFHLYIFIVPAWWMASRAGWLPQQDPMIVFMIVMAIWSVVWLIRKYR